MTETTVSLKRPGDALIRSAVALVAGHVLPSGEAAYLRSKGSEEVTELVLRAAVTGATISDTGWAGTLARRAVVDFILSLAPLSAAAELMRRSLGLDFPPGVQELRAPGVIAQAVSGGFVAEGQPGRVIDFSLSGPLLAPKKLMIISAVSRELAKTSNVESIVREALSQSAALTIDAAAFSTAAATAAAPAGLLNGGVALPPSTDGGLRAMREDIFAVASAVAPLASGDIVLIAHPDLAVAMQLQDGAPIPYPILPSAGIPAGTIAAVAPRGLVFSADQTPELNVSGQAVLHMEDTAPANIGAAGSPPVAAAPTMSMFQAAAIAIRLILTVTWAPRHPAAVVYVQGVDWS